MRLKGEDSAEGKILKEDERRAGESRYVIITSCMFLWDSLNQ